MPYGLVTIAALRPRIGPPRGADLPHRRQRHQEPETAEIRVDMFMRQIRPSCSPEGRVWAQHGPYGLRRIKQLSGPRRGR
jgi:hypothetical protein